MRVGSLQALTGHTGHILSLYTWGGGPIFVSGSQVSFTWLLKSSNWVANTAESSAAESKRGRVKKVSGGKNQMPNLSQMSQETAENGQRFVFFTFPL
jgi:hypothetical protein